MTKHGVIRTPAACSFGSMAAFILLCALLPASPSHAVPGAEELRDNLYATSFVSAERGWVVGAFGTIFQTRDGGASWEAQRSGTAEHLFGVDFANADVGWVVGRSGVVLQTVDGGRTWTAQRVGRDRHLFSVEALGPQRAVAIGDWGQIWVTEDGGQNWEDRSLPRDVILNGQSWADARHGWLVGEMGAVFSTGDGGKTWQEQDSGVMKTLFGVYFRDLEEGWATGIDGLILHTADGGRNWTVRQGNVDVSALDQVGFAQALGNASLYDVAVRGNRGYAVGDVGTVWTSDDGGKTWTRATVPAAAGLRWIRAVAMVSDRHGLLVGAGGLAIRVNGGQLHLP